MKNEASCEPHDSCQQTCSFLRSTPSCPRKNHLLTWLHHALLHASCMHITYFHNPETSFHAFFCVIVNCFSLTAKTEKFACLATFEFNFHGVQHLASRLVLHVFLHVKTRRLTSVRTSRCFANRFSDFACFQRKIWS